MLAHLRVRDLVLIDELDIELSSKFNVLTGETGAGKSLVATAVDLLLGRRAHGGLVRKGCQEAEIEGLFDIADEPQVKKRLTQGGFPAEDELLVRRVIPSEGRHRCYVNGRLASLSLLAELAEGLARITSQHEQHSLMDPASQLELLDGYGGLAESAQKMADLYALLEQATHELAALREKKRDRATRLDYLEYQLKEIDTVAPEPGELEELEVEIERMKNQELLASTAVEAADELYERDGAIFERLGSLVRKLDEAARHDPSLAASTEQIRDAAAAMEDAARFLIGYKRRLDDDPERLSRLEDRRESIVGLLRKHGTDLDGLLEQREQMAAEIATLSRYEESLVEAEGAVAQRLEDAEKHAAELSRKRKRAGAKLSKAVTRELADLKFEKAGFEAAVDIVDGDIRRTGVDKVEFLVTLNPGEGAHPLRKAASGGELSRLMLAVKRALAGVGPVGTYVFDEVDAGIGGQVAAAVGRKLREVADHHQVICITHMPQIAGMADAHLLVSKGTEGGRTYTAVRHLDREERIDELSRMLAGEKVTKKTRAAARELLE